MLRDIFLCFFYENFGDVFTVFACSELCEETGMVFVC